MSKNIVSETENNDIQDDILELVKARVSAIPDNVRISIGATEYSKKDLLDNIENKSEVGQEFIEMQIDYLRDLASGALYAG